MPDTEPIRQEGDKDLAESAARVANGTIAVTPEGRKLLSDPNIGDQVLEALEQGVLQGHKEGGIDSLTGLYNRTGFCTVMEETILRIIGTNGIDAEPYVMGMVLVDMNLLKTINDSYGKEVGDEFLTIYAKCAKESFRDYDALGRVGGDEFIFALITRSSGDTRITQETFVKEEGSLRRFMDSVNEGVENRKKSLDSSKTDLFGQMGTGGVGLRLYTLVEIRDLWDKYTKLRAEGRMVDIVKFLFGDLDNTLGEAKEKAKEKGECEMVALGQEEGEEGASQG